MDNKFRFVMPADLEKGDDGSYKVRGLASTQGIDQQGETIIQKGIDLTPIDKKKGILNWDHQKGPENTIGLLDGYTKGNNGLYVEGRLFKNHTKAKAVREIMESLGEGDRGRIGLSVEGQILERDDKNPKVIKKCRINAVALTMNPVNTDTFADLVKSMNSADEVEFDSTEDHNKDEPNTAAMFTADQVLQIVQKALGVGDGGLAAPNTRTSGDALAQEDMDKDKKKVDPKKMKKMKKSEYVDGLQTMMSKLQVLYPDVSRTDLWIAVQERMNTKFPDINESFGKGGPGSGKRGHRTFSGGTTLDGLVSERTKQKMRQTSGAPESSEERRKKLKQQIAKLESQQYNSQSGLTQKQIDGKLKNLRMQLKGMKK